MKAGPAYLLQQLPSREILENAACGPKVALLFEPVTKTGSEGCNDDSVEEGHRRQDVAKMICNRCPVKQLCYEDGVRNRREGVYGGVSMTARYHRDLTKPKDAAA